MLYCTHWVDKTTQNAIVLSLVVKAQATHVYHLQCFLYSSQNSLCFYRLLCEDWLPVLSSLNETHNTVKCATNEKVWKNSKATVYLASKYSLDRKTKCSFTGH